MVNLEDLQKLDYELSYKFASLLPYHSTSRKVIQILTMTGTAFFWLTGLALVYFLVPNYREEAFSMVWVTLIMAIPVFIIKHTLKRNRPDFKDTRFGAVVFDVWSFPSGHATRATYVMMLLPIYTPELAIFWYIWGLTMIISRLLLGVHYISDILGGIILSLILISSALLLNWLPYVPFYDLVS